MGKRLAVPLRAFTLLEVVLAIIIAVGMLVVVLYFYQQSADLRTQLILESERISSSRLLMDRLTSELRSASALSSSRIAFAGDSSSMRFITTMLPSRSERSTGASARLAGPQTDLKLVSYGLGSSIEGSNTVVTGLVRQEQSTVETRERSASTRTNELSSEVESKPSKEARGPKPLTDAIRYLRFRYWDGGDWKESWSAVELPKAVEVTFGSEPLPERTEADDYPFDLFRRVIYLPGSEASGGLGAISVTTEDSLPGEEAR